MNIQKISHTNLNNNFKIQNKRQNATPVFQNEMDSFVGFNTKNTSFKGNILDKWYPLLPRRVDEKSESAF